MEKENVNGIQFAYQKYGQGKPLILLHGYPLDNSIWDKVVPLLEKDFLVICPDLRGFGESEVIEDEYKIVDMADDILGLLDHLGIDNTAIAGHSMGGYVTLAFASSYPERVTGLGLIATQALADTAEVKKGRYQAVSDVQERGVQHVANTFSQKLTPDIQLQSLLNQLIIKQKPAGLAGALRAMAERENSIPKLPGFSFPVVIVHGYLDELIPISRAQDMSKDIPESYLTELSDCGHMPMLEKPSETAKALNKLR